MPKISISQGHKVAATDARKSIEELGKELAEKYGLTSRWITETEAKVERTGVTGSIKIEPQRVLVDLDLSFALTPLKGTIEGRIRDHLKKIFETA